MKRFHVHIGVANIADSISFYTHLFGTAPSVTKADYAKWMLDDPHVNFAISSKEGVQRGIEHLGIQAEDEGELAAVYDRLKAADRPVLEEGATVCCYAQSEKSWIADPDGVVWEAFLTKGESTVYGGNPELERLASANAAATACCTPETPQDVCCPPKADKPVGAPCCG